MERDQASSSAICSSIRVPPMLLVYVQVLLNIFVYDPSQYDSILITTAYIILLCRLINLNIGGGLYYPLLRQVRLITIVNV